MKIYKGLILSIVLIVSSLQAFTWDSYEQFSSAMGYEREYDKAISIAKKENKDLFIIEVSEGCPFCHRLVDTILTKDSIREYINKKYVKLLINRDTDKNVPKTLLRPFSPVTFIIDAKSGQIIDEVDGWMEEDNYLWHL